MVRPDRHRPGPGEDGAAPALARPDPPFPPCARPFTPFLVLTARDLQGFMMFIVHSFYARRLFLRACLLPFPSDRGRRGRLRGARTRRRRGGCVEVRSADSVCFCVQWAGGIRSPSWPL